MNAANHDRRVRITVQKSDEELLTNARARRKDLSGAVPRLADANPSAAPLVVRSIAIPRKLDAHPPEFVAEDLGLRRSDDDRALGICNAGLSRPDWRIIGDVSRHG